MVRPIILQVVGYQNSGKTTLTTKLIKGLSNLGLKAVTIKHHGHGGKPEVTERKDSTRHLAAGAMASIVEGEGRLILQTEYCPISLDDQIMLLGFFQPDVILIEGYKQENYPKLFLLRNKEDMSLITRLDNIKIIMCWEEELKKHLEGNMDIPVFSIHDDLAVDQVINELRN